MALRATNVTEEPFQVTRDDFACDSKGCNNLCYPMIISGCPHKWCSTCDQSSPNCPICHANKLPFSIPNAQMNLLMERELSLTCHTYGCGYWDGLLGILEHQKTCQEQPQPCPIGCAYQGLHDEIPKHMETCRQSAKACPYANKPDAYRCDFRSHSDEAISQHQSTCTYAPYTCPICHRAFDSQKEMLEDRFHNSGGIIVSSKERFRCHMLCYVCTSFFEPHGMYIFDGAGPNERITSVCGPCNSDISSGY